MMQTRQINNEVQSVGVDHFYELYQKEKRRYPPSFFCMSNPSKLKRKKPVDKKLFRKIILEYLKMYFYDLYTTRDSIYFPLGGFMKKVIYPKWLRVMGKSRKENRVLSGTEGSIGLFWYMRASARFHLMIKVKKLTGSSNRLPKLEDRLKNIINKDLIPIFKPEFNKKKENKSLYLCTLTSSPSRKS